VASTIREQIRQELNLTASAGVAPNKFLAKIASDWRKPDRLFVIQPEEVDAFLAPFGLNQVPPAPLREFNKTIDLEKLQALAEALESAQHDEGVAGSCVHAYLHRKEGDQSNAAYWYSRAGKPFAASRWMRSGSASSRYCWIRTLSYWDIIPAWQNPILPLCVLRSHTWF
jgi:impB/mucB/samB family